MAEQPFFCSSKQAQYLYINIIAAIHCLHSRCFRGGNVRINSMKEQSIARAMSSKVLLIIEFRFAREIFHRKRAALIFYFCLNASHLLLEVFSWVFPVFNFGIKLCHLDKADRQLISQEMGIESSWKKKKKQLMLL